MRNWINILLLSFISSSIVILLKSSLILAENIGSIWHSPSFLSQSQVLPTQSISSGDILVDNFEYWDSPYNHGWIQETPSYPVYGFGIGYSLFFETFLDLQEGSRVLNAYRPSSVFLLSTPYEKYFINKNLFSPATSTNPGGASGISLDPNNPDFMPILSYKWWAPIGIEQWDTFEFQVFGKTRGNDGIAETEDDHSFIIMIKPLEHYCDEEIRIGSNLCEMRRYKASLVQMGSSSSPMIIQVDIGNNFNSGTWHTIWLDLNEINRKANNGFVPAGWEFARATHIKAGGPTFRLDDIIFRKKDPINLLFPDIVELGPRYAQLYEPLRFLIMAEYEMDGEIARITDLLLDSGNFLTERNLIVTAWLGDSKENGIIQADPNYLDPNHPNYGQPEPYYTNLLGRPVIIDINLPLFADPELRIRGRKAAALRGQILEWRSYVGGWADKGTQTTMIKPLPIDPYDGMPTYIMLWYWSGFKAVFAENRFPSDSFGLTHYGPLECFILESALYNAGFTLWPHIAYMDYTPQVIENLMVTVMVSNGITSDTDMFPISVVNYPVENYPPIVQMRCGPGLIYIGEEWKCGRCTVFFADPDCYVFSLAQFEGRTPGTNHLPALSGNIIRDDQDQLVHKGTVNGLPSYQYGPWTESVLNPHNGIVNHDIWKFEATYDITVTCTDNYGATSTGQIPITVLNRFTWLNHAPIIMCSPNRPVVTRAGEELILTAPQLGVIEPDGEQLFASCNLGSSGKTSDGAFTWSFQPNFPGLYNAELFFYDERGAFTVMQFAVDVTPWWAQ